MPTASLIIPYLHENFTLIKQTVGSIIQNTPLELLEEIIFIDDANVEGWSKRAELEALHPKVRVHRNEKRQGLTKAKVTGAALATSPVIIFMEPHCRANRHWLEPLLEQLLASPNHKLIAVPVIDIIPEAHTDRYYYIDPQTGGFDWNMAFSWDGAAQKRNASYKKPDPFPMPALSGGILAMWRDWWVKSGTYDAKMTEWGSENIEMSLRIWRCGGSIVTVPCSRIGHMFRTVRPYPFNNDAAEVNKKRLVKVWMDNYEEKVYAADPYLRHMDAGPLEDRFHLKKHLQCKSMDWYLDHVYPERKA